MKKPDGFGSAKSRLQQARDLLAKLISTCNIPGRSPTKAIASLVLLAAFGVCQAQEAQVSAYNASTNTPTAGAAYTYIALIGNSDASVASANVVLTMTVPAGTTFVSAAIGQGSCALPSAGAVVCSIGAIPANAVDLSGGAVQAVLTLVANRPGVVSSTASIVSGADTNSSDNTETQNVTIQNGADLTVTAGAPTPNPVIGGANATFTFNLNNNGPSDSVAPQMALVLGGNLQYVSASGTGWSCLASGQTVTCSIASVAANTIPATITLVAKTLIGSGTLSVTATGVAVTTPDPDPSNNTTIANVTVNAGADLSITSLVASLSTVVSGSNDNFTITAHNNGPSAANVPLVTNTLPAGWTYVSATGANYTCGVSGQILSCNRSTDMAVDATDTITVVTSAPPGISTATGYTDTAGIVSTTADPNSSNNAGSVGVTVSPDGTDLQLLSYTRQGAGTPSPTTPVPAGSSVTQSASVKNLGPRAATGNVQIAFALASSETYVSSSGPWSCTYTSPNLLCTYTGGLAVGSTTSTLSFTTTINAGTSGTLTSYACTGGSTPSGGIASAEPTNGFNDFDAIKSNNCSGAVATTVSATSADLSIAVVTTTPSGGDKIVSTLESSATYTITAANSGPNSSDHVTVSFPVPGYLSGQTTGSVDASGAPNFSCGAFAATITCTESASDTMLASPANQRVFVVTANRAMNDTWTSATPRQAASVTATATINSTTVGDPVRGNNSGSDTVEIDPLADLTIPSMSVSTSPINANVNVTYTITVKNLGPSVSEGLSASVVFDDPRFTLVSATTTYSGAGCSFDNNLTVTCSGYAKFASNQQETIAIVVRPNFVAGEPVRTMNATATAIAGRTTDPTTANNARSVALSIVASSTDMLVNIDDSLGGAGPDPLGFTPGLLANNSVVYHSVSTNNGPSLASNVSITSSYTPAVAGRNYLFEGVSTSPSGPWLASAAGYSCNNAVGTSGSTAAPLTTTCNFTSNIASGGSQVLYWNYQIDTSPNAGGESYTNSVTVHADETDPLPSNNTASVHTTVRSRADLGIVKATSNATPNIDEPFNWVLTLTNNGPGLGENVVVTDTVPAGFTIIGSPTWTTGGSTSGSSCAVAGQVVTCTASSTMNPLDVVTISINNKANSAASVAPTTTINSAAVTTQSVDPVSSNNTSSATVTVKSIALTGRVWLDANLDGIIQGGETTGPSPVLTVTLTGNDAYGNALPTTTTTTSTTAPVGSYAFSKLPPSDGSGYTITTSWPASAVAGNVSPAATQTNGGSYTSATPTYAGVVIPAAVTSLYTAANYNFPYYPLGTISGVVYMDANANGAWNGAGGGDLAISGAIVNLLAGGTRIATTTTNGASAYSFTGLSPYTVYTLEEPLPSSPTGLANGSIQLGTFGAVACTPICVAQPNTPIANTDHIANIDFTKAQGNAAINFNFGELTSATISGTVFVDLNNNGSLDTGDTGIAGVTLDLTGIDVTGAAVNSTTTSAADGTFFFANLLPGTYQLDEPNQPPKTFNGTTTAGSAGGAGSNPTATSSRIAAIHLTGTTSSLGNLFAEQASGAISGYVYGDANNNGVKDSGESGIADVIITLTGLNQAGTAVSLTTSTATDGSYSFSNLLPSNAGGYALTETQPNVTADGKTTIPAGSPGTATSAKPVLAGGTDTISNIVLRAGATLAEYDFGEQVGSTLSGFVYVDADNNGIKDAGEAGIAGVTLKLSGNDARGAAVSQTAVSAADGSFAFANLAASDSSGYTLAETQPAAYTDGKTTRASGSSGLAASGKPVGVGNNDVIGGIKLSAGVNLTGFLYGELAVPSLKPPIVNGYVWLDLNRSRVRPQDGSQPGQPGWIVQLKQHGTLICSVSTDSSGFYQFDNLHCPGYESSGLPLGSGYAILFSKNGNRLPNVPISGGNRGLVPSSGGEIDNLTLQASDIVIEQNLPLDPSGVVYDSLTRAPVPGATVTISGPAGFDPATHLVGGLAAQVQTVGSDGMYQFLLQNNYPSGNYMLNVGAPAGYLPGASASLPPCNGSVNVGLIPSPALIQASDGAPPLSVPPQTNPSACVGVVAGGAASTQYYLGFGITHGGSAPIVNNQIPLDPIPLGGLVVSKTTPMVNTSVGGLVPYTITVANTLNVALTGIDVRDQMPPGFKYRSGSATRNGVAAAPAVSGRTLDWANQNFATLEKKVYTLILAVGSGVGDGEYTNQAWAANGSTNARLSNLATATVRIVPDPTFDCPDIIGKVFDDRNANGYQDQGEPGIPGVRLATPRGLLITTDAEGRFHVPCPDIPNPDRGSNFVLKLDDRTLPSGYRLTTENPRDVRLTRGKLSKINFGATIHRVIRLELSDAAFLAGSEQLLPEWQKQMSTLQEQLKLRPCVVRIAYARGTEAVALARLRTRAMRDDILRHWKEQKGNYTLLVETESAQ